MVTVKRNGKRIRLYPVCSFEKNQHKLYNALDRARIREDEDGCSDELGEEIERIEKALEAFNRYVIGNTVYATYEDSVVIRDIVASYDIRHDMAGDWKS